MHRLVIYNRAVWPYILISACDCLLLTMHTEQGTEIYYYHALGLRYIPRIQIHYVQFIWVYLIFRDNVRDQVKKNTAKPNLGHGATILQKGVSNSVVHQIKTLLFDSMVNQIKITPSSSPLLICGHTGIYMYHERPLPQIVNLNRKE